MAGAGADLINGTGFQDILLLLASTLAPVQSLQPGY